VVAGGGEIYREAIALADRLYITHVAVAPPGDTRFPAIDPDQWRVAAEPDVPRSDRDSADFRVKVYTRQ
jgi:dihydrofolate reductase